LLSMKTCSAIKSNGERCQAWPLHGSEFCLWHHPERAAMNGRKGGKGPSDTSQELARLQDEFERLAVRVEKGKLDKGVGAVAGTLLNYARACVRDAISAREQEELVQRLEALESALSQQRRNGSHHPGPYRLS
jgi:hypothetical protein